MAIDANVAYVECREDGSGTLHPAPMPVKTCATCQWWSENTNLHGIGLKEGRCFKGVRVGSPTRQSPDGGLYVAATFGCNQWQVRDQLTGTAGGEQ